MRRNSNGPDWRWRNGENKVMQHLMPVDEREAESSCVFKHPTRDRRETYTTRINYSHSFFIAFYRLSDKATRKCVQTTGPTTLCKVSHQWRGKKESSKKESTSLYLAFHAFETPFLSFRRPRHNSMWVSSKSDTQEVEKKTHTTQSPFP